MSVFLLRYYNFYFAAEIIFEYFQILHLMRMRLPSQLCSRVRRTHMNINIYSYKGIHSFSRMKEEKEKTTHKKAS